LQRCDRHGLNYDPALTSGCVLCRRDVQPTRPVADASGASPWPLIAKVIAGLGVLGFAVHHYVGQSDPPTPTASSPRLPPRGARTSNAESTAAAELPPPPAPTTTAPAGLHPLDPQLWTEVAAPFEPLDALDPAAQELRDHYGIHFYVPKTAELNVEHGKLTGTRPTPAQISEAALALRKELARYPSEFIAAIGFQRLVLIEGLKHKGVPASAFAIAPAAAMLATPAMFSNPFGLHHELFHFADYRLLGRPPDDSAWIALNAPGTRYGSGGRRMVASTTGSYGRLNEPRRDLPGFVTEYATSAPEEDRADVFAMLLAQPTLSTELAASDPAIAAKMRYVTAAVERLCPRPCALIEQPPAPTTAEVQPPAPPSRAQTITVPLTTRAPLSSLAEIQRRVGWSNADLSAPDLYTYASHPSDRSVTTTLLGRSLLTRILGRIKPSPNVDAAIAASGSW
jgi:hypothetical protein